MQIFEFELVDQPVVTAPGATVAPSPASARAMGREPLPEHDELLHGLSSFAVPCFVRVSAVASLAALH